MNDQFFLENTFNLKLEFLYDNFNKKILLNCFVKIVKKTHVLNLMHFQGEMVHFFPQKPGALKQRKY